MQEEAKKPDTEISNNKSDTDTKKSIEDGSKAIEIEKKVGAKTEDESHKDAEQWRNEG